MSLAHVTPTSFTMGAPAVAAAETVPVAVKVALPTGMDAAVQVTVVQVQAPTPEVNTSVRFWTRAGATSPTTTSVAVVGVPLGAPELVTVTVQDTGLPTAAVVWSADLVTLRTVSPEPTTTMGSVWVADPAVGPVQARSARLEPSPPVVVVAAEPAKVKLADSPGLSDPALQISPPQENPPAPPVCDSVPPVWM